MNVHPLKAAIDELHAATTRLHNAAQDFSWTEGEKEATIGVLLDLLPEAAAAAQSALGSLLMYAVAR